MKDTETREELEAVAQVLSSIVATCMVIPIEQAEQFVDSFGGYDNLAIFDPTRWMREQENAHRADRVARAFLAFRRVLEEERGRLDAQAVPHDR